LCHKIGIKHHKKARQGATLLAAQQVDIALFIYHKIRTGHHSEIKSNAWPLPKS